MQKIFKLYKVCAENNVKEVCVGKTCYEVDSETYELQKDWFIKGEYQIEKDFSKGINVLHCQRLEKDITITINRPIVNGEDLSKEQELLKEMANEVFTVAVFNRRTLNSVGKEIKRAHIPAFVEAVLESHYKKTGEKGDPKDFGIVRIDWEKKNLFLESLQE